MGMLLHVVLAKQNFLSVNFYRKDEKNQKIFKEKNKNVDAISLNLKF